MADGYRILTRELIREVSEKAAASPRKRMNENFHLLEDNVQRMLNAVEPGSYVRPHRHIAPPKVEFFLVLKGCVTVLFFDENGQVREAVHLDPIGRPGIDIQAGVWHSLFSRQPGTVLFEVKDGPYNPYSDKDFAIWAPDENSSESLQLLKEWEDNWG